MAMPPSSQPARNRTTSTSTSVTSYDLTYRDPQWLIKTAELHARQGRPADSVAALRTAVIGARSETADADFEIAERLESWRILTDAVQARREAAWFGSALELPGAAIGAAAAASTVPPAATTAHTAGQPCANAITVPFGQDTYFRCGFRLV